RLHSRDGEPGALVDPLDGAQSGSLEREGDPGRRRVGPADLGPAARRARGNVGLVPAVVAEDRPRRKPGAKGREDLCAEAGDGLAADGRRLELVLRQERVVERGRGPPDLGAPPEDHGMSDPGTFERVAALASQVLLPLTEGVSDADALRDLL